MGLVAANKSSTTHQIDVLSHSYLCVQRDVNKSTHADSSRRKGVESLLRPRREKGEMKNQVPMDGGH